MRAWFRDLFYGMYSVVWWLLQRRPRHVLAWLGALFITGAFCMNAWLVEGQVTCDFGNQWLMGAMFVYERGPELYLVSAQKEVFAEGYEGKTLEKMIGDVLLKGWGDQKPLIEGPLYPPTAGLLFWPTAILPPVAAHAVHALLYLQLAFLGGWLISYITQKRIQWGEASLILLVYPNLFQGVLLGQNSVLTLTIVVVGWAFLARGWPFIGGLVWGLLAYKPVFAVALILVPLLLPNRRMFFGMVLAGVLFCAATLPFVGVTGLERLVYFGHHPEPITAENVSQTNPWERWLLVGQHAADIYSYDRNWVWMSRDLVGLPRRRMWPSAEFFSQLPNLFRFGDISTWPAEERDAVTDGAVLHLRFLFGLDEWDEVRIQQVTNTPVRTAIGWGLVGLVAFGTTAVAVFTWRSARRRGERVGTRADGARSAFVLLGGMLCVYHFMHYDLLPTALPAMILLAELGRMRWPARIWLVFCVAGLIGCNVHMAYGHGIIRVPFETFLVLALWVTSGWWAVKDELAKRREARASDLAVSQPPAESLPVEDPAAVAVDV
jgi:hypothetical protein